MKISKSQLKTIIKEEALKFKRAIELKKELAEIEKQLNEVKAGEVMATDGVHGGQKKAVFASKGNPALKMEDADEVDSDEVDMDIPADIDADVDVDVDTDVVDTDVPSEDLGGDTVSKVAIKSAIEQLEAALGLHLGGEEVGVLPGEEGEEEFEFDTDEELPSAEGEEVASEEDAEEIDEKLVGNQDKIDANKNGKIDAEDFKILKKKKKEGETVKEYGDEHPVSTKDAVENSEETVKENLDEPIEGKSVAQMTTDSKVDDGMEKDKHVKESTEDKKETIAEAEKKRMAFLAGILKG